MLVTKEKPLAVLLENIGEEETLFIVACGGCPVGAETGGIGRARALAKELEARGKKVPGCREIDFLCNKALVGVKLGRVVEKLDGVDSLLVMSCGIGVQAVANMVDMPVHPVLDTITMGFHQGLWPSSERCGECGECKLSDTGGICPVTACSKSLLNGQCGGAKDGMCEVHPEKPCAWQQIYERLAQQGRLDRIRKLAEVRDYNKMNFPMEMRRTTRWALEVDEEPVTANAETTG